MHKWGNHVQSFACRLTLPETQSRVQRLIFKNQRYRHELVSGITSRSLSVHSQRVFLDGCFGSWKSQVRVCLDGCFGFEFISQSFLNYWVPRWKRPAQAPKRKAVKTRPKPKQKVAKQKVATQKASTQKVAQEMVAKDFEFGPFFESQCRHHAGFEQEHPWVPGKIG